MRVFTAARLAEMRLPGLPTTARTVRLRADRDGWLYEERRGNGGLTRFYTTEPPFPQDVRAVIEHADHAPIEVREDIPEDHRDVARTRLRVIARVEELVHAGSTKLDAIETAARECKVGARSARRWLDAVRERPRADWFAILTPRYKECGRRSSADRVCHPDAYAYFRDEYLRPSKPAYAAVYDRLREVATHNAWAPIPSLDTLVRRLEREVPRARRHLLRDGEEALERRFPAQQRSRAHLGALHSLTADGHKFDVMVRWPDGSIERPVMVSFQDLYSGKLLSWRVDRTENADLARLAFLDVVRNFGIPEELFIDNGRAWASKQNTGGTATRFRFKRKPEDPKGVFTELCAVHWCLPYHGQAKPIERAFGDLAERVSRHPAFEGAYTGASTVTKPSNYGTRVVELDEFMRVLAAQIKAHNAREERNTEVCAKKLSFDQAFDASYVSRPIRKASDAQIRRLLLSAEGVTVRSGTADVRLAGNRYWTEELLELEGERVIVCFDPNELKAGVHVYRLDNTYVAFARCIEATGFNDTQAARDHIAARRAFVKAAKKAALAERRYTAAELARMHLDAQGVPAPPPSATIVRPAFGVASLPPTKKVRIDIGPTREQLAEQEELEEQIGLLAAATRGA